MFRVRTWYREEATEDLGKLKLQIEDPTTDEEWFEVMLSRETSPVDHLPCLENKDRENLQAGKNQHPRAVRMRLKGWSTCSPSGTTIRRPQVWEARPSEEKIRPKSTRPLA